MEIKSKILIKVRLKIFSQKPVRKTNTQNKNIEIRSYSLIGCGQFGNEWAQRSYYILGEGSTPQSPQVFNSQTIPAGEWRYVYYGADIVEGNNIQDLPAETNSYEVFINIHFNIIR